MTAPISLLIILTVSILVTRIATTALVHTGLSSQSARFQARSAFTGVGFTTSEAEKVVDHPVRRRILMLLMLLGNAGIVSAVASMLLTFVDGGEDDSVWWELGFLFVGIAVLWMVASSKLVDRYLSRLIDSALDRWTDLDVRDYASVLRLGGDYRIAELRVEDEDWMAGHELRELKLRDEGIVVLGIQYPDGEYMGVPTGETSLRVGQVLTIYGRSDALANLDKRADDAAAARAHDEAVAAQEAEVAKGQAKDEADERRVEQKEH